MLANCSYIERSLFVSMLGVILVSPSVHSCIVEASENRTRDDLRLTVGQRQRGLRSDAEWMRSGHIADARRFRLPTNRRLRARRIRPMVRRSRGLQGG